MNLLTIMVVTLTTGEVFGLQFDSAKECGDALGRIEMAEDALGVTVDTAQCIETLAPATSPRPRPRPEWIK